MALLEFETYLHLTPFGFRVMMNLKALRRKADKMTK